MFSIVSLAKILSTKTENNYLSRPNLQSVDIITCPGQTRAPDCSSSRRIKCNSSHFVTRYLVVNTSLSRKTIKKFWMIGSKNTQSIHTQRSVIAKKKKEKQGYQKNEFVIGLTGKEQRTKNYKFHTSASKTKLRWCNFTMTFPNNQDSRLRGISERTAKRLEAYSHVL